MFQTGIRVAVKVSGDLGTVVGTNGAKVEVRLDGRAHTGAFFPADALELE